MCGLRDVLGCWKLGDGNAVKPSEGLSLYFLLWALIIVITLGLATSRNIRVIPEMWAGYSYTALAVHRSSGGQSAPLFFSLRQLVWSVAQPGVKGVKLCPLLRSRGPFLIRTIKYCNLSLSEISENEQFTRFGGPMSGLQRSILSLRGDILGLRGPNLDPKGTLESKVDEND